MGRMEQNWKRLAELAISRRVQLGYTRRTEFARVNGLSHDRTIFDLEHARRTNFGPATIAQIEQVYQWLPGSVRAVLEGGEPTLRETEQVALFPPEPADPVDAWIGEIEDTALPDDVKTALIAQLELLRQQRQAM